MDKIVVSAADGAQMVFVKQGAHLCSWMPAGGSEQLFLSQTSEFTGGAAIRGGVPLVFPQFSGMGNLPKHGFARTADWELLSAGQTVKGEAQAVFALQENAERLQIWPHSFRIELQAIASANQLALRFAVHNTGGTAFSFSAALHTYFRVADLAQTQIHGLAGLSYHDTVTGQASCRQQERVLLIAGEIDRIYTDVIEPVLIKQVHQTLQITQTGFQDAVVWNPGAQKAQQMADLEANGYQNMLCVEAGQIMHVVNLAPGASWSGSQSMQSLPK